MELNLIFLLIGLLVGTAVGWLIARVMRSKVSSESSDLTIKLQLEVERSKKLYDEIQLLNSQLKEEREKVLHLNNQNATLKANYQNIQTKLEEQRGELSQLQQKFTTEFKNLANEIFEEKSKKFTDQNKVNLDELLKPLGEKITDFERKVEQANQDNLKRNTALDVEIRNLKDLNLKITKEAENLTKALKGESQTRGSWGELILESILEKSGLENGREYFIQETITNEEGRRFRPDVVVRLPDNKNIVIDSKVSLVSYDKYVSTEDDEEKARHLKAHIQAIRTHVKSLSQKNYQQLYKLDNLDYVLMFIPIEPSFLLAIQNDHQLYDDAHDKNIIIVSPTNLIATLRTIVSIWKQEYQNRNAVEIARQGGALYDKFVALVEELLKVGHNIKKTQSSYEDAMNKLTTGKDNLIRKTERLKELGAKTSKNQDDRLLERADQQSLF